MAADQFCLRWNNFQSNIVTALDSLKTEEDLVDVTLVCEAHAVKAHKVILSACSPYFRNVFKENPCQHPVVILKDVSADDVEALLSFMYQGEVYISQERLPSFLRTAELLQVRGLTGASAPSNSIPLSDVPTPAQQTITTPPAHPPPSVPALRPSSGHHRSSKVARSAGSPPPLSVLPLPSSAVTTSSKQSDASPQAKRRKAIPRRVPITPTPEELSVVTKQEPYDDDDMGLCHEEDIKPGLSGDEDIEDNDSSRQQGIITSASQSPLASDESTSMLARSLTAPRNSDASGSHSPVQTSQFGMEPTSGDQLSPGTQTGAGRPLGGLPRVAQGGTCPHCGQEYANQSSLKYHVRLVHSEMTDRACCHLCPLSFRTRESFKLKQHMKEAHNVHY